ncbi:MAG: urea carboxylase [Verrucomicrobiota bacterium]
MPLFTKVLIANRGEIACRIIRALRRLEIKSVAVYSEADRHAMHVNLADEAVCIGPAPARDSYLNAARILQVAQETGAQAIHPGYGFLSENAAFAEECESAGIAFIGPTPEQIRKFGLKHTSREIAQACGVPLLPGTGLLADADEAVAEAERIGWPVMLKSTAGGGGIGMQLCRGPQELRERFETVRNLGRSNFKDDGLFLEKFVEIARHVEVQIFGDGCGNVIALGERDCSTQRRNQKVIEETPAPGLTADQREALCAAAVRLGREVGYRSAGTVEFVFDVTAGAFYFLEVNTRLQVEHGVTEMVTGIDLVEWMFRVAAGEPPDLLSYVHAPHGHSIQVRIYAEDPGRDFQPGSGLLTHVVFPGDVRCDTWIETGTEVSPFYDPLLAKLIVHAETRESALAGLDAALGATRVAGIETNRDYLRQVVASPEFQRGEVWTGFLRSFVYAPRTIEVVAGGTMTTVQDLPGRLGHWAVGVPPSGPMDPLSFRLANRILNNLEKAAGLEMTLSGATLRFHAPTTICLAGAPMRARLDGEPVPFWCPVKVNPGQTLAMGAIECHGCRTYLAVRGGLDVPKYLGSRSTFTLGQFGGHAGRALRVGDILKLRNPHAPEVKSPELDCSLVPKLTDCWEIGVLYGPHGAPDFFTEDDITQFFETEWKVHFNSARTGVRLIGPKPTWARRDGGEAGLHPSNIHDNAYAIGAVDLTGDMPIILGPDGPSLGGFVCPACVVQAELWKIGQLKGGDRVRCRAVSETEAAGLRQKQDAEISTLSPAESSADYQPTGLPDDAALLRLPETGTRPAVAYRPAGDDYLLIEYGPLMLDLELRFRVHALMTWLENAGVIGVIDLTPGIRSLQIHYDSRVLSRADLLTLLTRGEDELPSVDAMEVPSRIVHLPLSWDDPATRLAIEKYMSGVRPDAPWCPSNIEFIRRINDLESIEQVRDIVFKASYVVLGLGDVYLGAPVAVPLDPRHRLVTTKYNPARTWTPENAVGIGGTYLCVYGMEGPGGYQFVGRTIQMWNRWRTTVDFVPGKPWLLRFFDQIRFYPVSAEELLQMREDFPQGRFKLRTEETTFKLHEYRELMRSIADETAVFKEKREAAFNGERERWRQAGLDAVPDEPESGGEAVAVELAEGEVTANAPLPANVWQVLVQPGTRVEAGEKLVVLEAMKMEIAVTAPEAGVVTEILCVPGKQVTPGQPLCLIKTDL